MEELFNTMMADVQWISDAADRAHMAVFEDAKPRFHEANTFRAAITGALAQAYCDSIVEGLGEDATLDEVNAVISAACQFVAAQVLNMATGIETPLDFAGVEQ